MGHATLSASLLRDRLCKFNPRSFNMAAVFVTRACAATVWRNAWLINRSFGWSCCRLSDEKPTGRPPELDDYPGKEFTSSWQLKQKGKIYDKKPFKYRCEKGKAYKWCACGLSKNQPFCDGSHDGPLMKSVLRPVLFIAPEDKDYWFCNCKKTDHRPLCDGTHKNPDIQAAVKT